MSISEKNSFDMIGVELFTDSNTYLHDLTDEQTSHVRGGILDITIAAFGVGYLMGRDDRRREKHKAGNVCYP